MDVLYSFNTRQRFENLQKDLGRPNIAMECI